MKNKTLLVQIVRRIGVGVGCVAGLGSVCIFGALGYSMLEARWPRVKHVDVPVEGLERPVTIMQVADLHTHQGARWLHRFVMRSFARYASQVDIVVNTGDNFSTAQGWHFLRDLFSSEHLGSLPGCFVFGSNDYYAAKKRFPGLYLLARAAEHWGWSSVAERCKTPPQKTKNLPYKKFIRLMTSSGWIDLRNSSSCTTYTVADGEVPICWIGVDDPHIGRDRFPACAPDDTDTVGRSANMLRIGVTHAPYARVLDFFHDHDVDVVLAGHTHGGQLRIPFYGALVNNCDLPLSLSRGLFQWVKGLVKNPAPRRDTEARDIRQPLSVSDTLRDVASTSPQCETVLPRRTKSSPMWVYVSQGLGTNPYTPFRFACRPTLDIIHMKPAQDV